MPAADDPISEGTFEEVLSRYVDRLNAGESIDRLEIFTDHPEHADAILAELGTFVRLDAAPKEGENLGTLGDYTLRRQIGRGGMGVVYEAWEHSMDRRVALKVLPPGIAADERALQRFVREAKTAGQLNHPNVVGVYGMGLKEQTPYYAMELVDGETLACVLARLREAEPDAETVFGHKDSAGYFENLGRAFADVADGLQHAHAKKVIHRDIKPSNLILDRERRLRILDFGLARLEGQVSLTISGDVVGTPQYMSPEQARRKKVPVDHRTDVYSLGATLYEVLCGRPPFQGNDAADTLSQIIERDPVEPKKLNTRVPKDLETIVLKCLRKVAGDRYGTAEALAQDLRRFARGDPVEARAEGMWARTARRARRNRAGIAVATLLLLLLAASGLLLQSHRREVRARNETKARAAVMTLQLGMHFAGEDVPEDSIFYPSYVRVAERALADLREAAAGLPSEPGVHYQIAKALQFLLRFREAQEEISKALLLDPGFRPAHALRATILEWQGQGSLAEAKFQQLEAMTGPAWGKPWLAAYRAMAEERFQDAVGSYTQLLEMDRAEGELYLGSAFEIALAAGLARLQAQDHLRAIVEFTKAEVLWPDSIEPGLLKARAYYLLGRKDLAEEELSNLHGGSKAPQETALFITAMYFRLNDVPEAIEWSRKLPAGPLQEMVDIALLQSQGRVDAAEQAASHAVQAYPDSVDIRMALVGLLEHLGRFPEAREQLERILEIQPENASAAGGLARTLQEEGRNREAIAACEKALALTPRCIGALIVLGRAQSALSNLPEAVRAFERAHRFCPRSMNVQRHWGGMLLNHGLYEEAATKTSKAIELWPTNAHGHYDLACSLVGLGRLGDAVRACERALEVEPGFPWAFPLLGDALEKTGRVEEACDTYAEALILRPREGGATKRLVSLLRREGPSLRGRPSLGRLSVALEAEAERGVGSPLFWMALALTKLAAFSSEAPQTALEYALRGVEGAEASASDSELRLLATALDDLLAAVKESHASDEHRLALPPRLPPYAAIDRLLDGEPVRDAVNAERIVRSFRDSDGTTGSAKLAYLDGVILDRLGRHREAGEKLKVSVALEESRPEPLLALAQSLCAAGESASAAAVLRSALEGSQAGHRSIWDLWASVSFAHLRKTPVELLQDFPRAPAASYGGDLRWLLERLAADEPVRIRCGGEEHRTPDGAVFGKDRFFTGGNPAGPFDVEIAGMADAPLYLCERWFPADEMGSAGYRIPLPPGRYRVTLHFAEVWWYAPGLRKFDAVIEGRKVLEDYDPFAAGFATAEEKTWEVSIEDGLLEIEFLHKVNNPKVSAIEIERLD